MAQRLVIALAALLLLAPPAAAGAAVKVQPEIETRGAVTRLVVTVTNERRFDARTRPRGVSVASGGTRYVLRRFSARAARSVWRTRPLAATAVRRLAGARVTIRIRTRAATRRVRRRIAGPATAPGAPAPPVAPVPGVPPAPGGPEEPEDPDVTTRGELAVAVAVGQLGKPFVWGAADPAIGFDAPGLTQYAYGQVGVPLPRTVDQQFGAGAPAPADALRPGDLVFFRDGTGYVFHVGIFAGDAFFVHAPRTGDVVKLSSLNEPYYRASFAGARHIAD